MRKVKTALYTTIILIGAFFSIALFLPKEYSIERSIVVKTSTKKAFKFITDYSKRRSWSPWIINDPSIIIEIKGAPSQIGHYFKWSGEKVGKGILTIIDLEKPHLIESKYQTFTPFKSVSKFLWKIENLENGSTKITWIKKGKLPYPVGRVFGLGLETSIGPELVKGLENLKQILEN